MGKPDKLRVLLSGLVQSDKVLRKRVTSTASLSYHWAAMVAKGPWPDGEKAISSSAEYSYKYARLLGRPFPAGEAAILTSPLYSKMYLETVLGKKTWKALEAAFATKPFARAIGVATWYGRRAGNNGYRYDSHGDRLPNRMRIRPIEPVIASDPAAALSYAVNVLKGRFEEGEAAIAGDGSAALDYAKFIKARFPRGEPAIARLLARPQGRLLREKGGRIQPGAMRSYVRLGADRVCPEMERLLATDAGSAILYAQTIGQRFEAGERVIAEHADTSVKYARLLKAPFPAGEKVIARHGSWSRDYAVEVIKGRWEPGERAIAEGNPALARDYCIRAVARHLDPQGRLHRLDGPAVDLPGLKEYWVLGVHVSDEVFRNRGKITVADIRAIENAERRRAMIELMGIDRYLEQAKAKIVHMDSHEHNGTRALMQTQRKPAGRRRNPWGDLVWGKELSDKWLVCACPSTGRVYTMQVPPGTKTCEDADRFLAAGMAGRQVGRT